MQQTYNSGRDVMFNTRHDVQPFMVTFNLVLALETGVDFYGLTFPNVKLNLQSLSVLQIGYLIPSERVIARL